MPLDCTKLDKVVQLAGGGTQARCPACFEQGQDKKGNHLRIWPGGKYGCCLYKGDPEHRRRIFALAGGGATPVAYKPVEPVKQVPTINSSKLIKGWADKTQQSMLDGLASRLGVTSMALACLGAAWAPEYRAWAFPMRDGYGEMVGIRLRAESGFKWAVTGSHEGIFLPSCQAQSTGFILEGPTDTSAALSIGLFAIGRPTCNGAVPATVTALKRLGVGRAVIVADNDRAQRPNGTWWSPGVEGAEALANTLKIPTCIFVPPAKDFREFIRDGGNKQLIEVMIENMVWKV